MTESFGTEWGGLAVSWGMTYLPPHMEVPKSPKEDRVRRSFLPTASPPVSVPVPSPVDSLVLCPSAQRAVCGSLQDKVQQCMTSAERGTSVQEVEKQQGESDSLQKECDRLRKVMQPASKTVAALLCVDSDSSSLPLSHQWLSFFLLNAEHVLPSALI